LNLSRLSRLALVALAAATLAAGSSARPRPAASAHQAEAGDLPKLSPHARRGLAFAQARCAGCHGLTADAGSPNPESPPFEEIVNKPGLTRSTLRQFLRDSHNYPQAMKFTVGPADIDDLARYMVTLKRPGYRPAI
jgi:mono/diheme cytochrome c family protein